jgi:hypothetical protein
MQEELPVSDRHRLAIFIDLDRESLRRSSDASSDPFKIRFLQYPVFEEPCGALCWRQAI